MVSVYGHHRDHRDDGCRIVVATAVAGTAVIVGLVLIAVGLMWVSLATILIGLGVLAVTAYVVSR